MASALTRAHALLQAGQQPAAVEMVSQAAARGDADALHQLALWRLIGAPVPRDVAEGRRLLGQAAAAGHGDAALMHAALLANGSGGAPDWPGAMRALHTAPSTAQPIAADQRALLATMALRADGTPLARPASQALSEAWRIERFDQLLSPAECRHLMLVAGGHLQPSVVVDPNTGVSRPHPIRTSDGALIGPTREDPVIRALNLRLAAASGTDVRQGEALTVLRYSPGQEFRRHLDSLPATRNQRVLTMLVYLNDEFEGGETVFPQLGLSVRPRTGDALLFANTDAAGRGDERASHAGLPVRRGVKWLATRWIRARPFDVWTGPER